MRISRLLLCATMIANKPDGGSPSLQDYPRSDATVKAIAAQVWGDSKAKKGSNKFGKGRVFWRADPSSKCNVFQT